MKSILAVVAAMGVLSVIAFGGYSMHPTDSHASGCIASSVLGVLGCPDNGWMSALFSHLDALRVFSTAVMGAGFAMAFGVFALFVLCVAAFVAEHDFFARPVRDVVCASAPVRLRGVAWLSLHENSPSPAMSAGV